MRFAVIIAQFYNYQSILTVPDHFYISNQFILTYLFFRIFLHGHVSDAVFTEIGCPSALALRIRQYGAKVADPAYRKSAQNRNILNKVKIHS